MHKNAMRRRRKAVGGEGLFFHRRECAARCRQRRRKGWRLFTSRTIPPSTRYARCHLPLHKGGLMCEHRTLTWRRGMSHDRRAPRIDVGRERVVWRFFLLYIKNDPSLRADRFCAVYFLFTRSFMTDAIISAASSTSASVCVAIRLVRSSASCSGVAGGSAGLR